MYPGRFRLLHTVGGHEWTLELVRVQPEDEGGYQCQVRTAGHQTVGMVIMTA